MKKILFILSLVAALSLDAYSQVDTEFWLGVPRLSQAHLSLATSKICLTTFDLAATVTITQPGNPSFVPIVNTLPANSYIQVPIDPRDAGGNVNPLPDNINPYGLLISSTNAISAYYSISDNDGWNNILYALKGKNAEGNNFIVPMQYQLGNTPGTNTKSCPDARSSIEIVATQDSTAVNITPSAACQGRPNVGVPFTIYMNRGDLYTLRAFSNSAGGHLENTIITSTQPIVVNSTDDMVGDGGSAAGCGDQLVPVDLAGSTYLAVSNGGINDWLCIFPTAANTVVTINGTKYASMNVGGKMTFPLTTASTIVNPTAYITSTSPIVVYQVSTVQGSYGGNEIGASILPRLDCTGSNETVYKPGYFRTSANPLMTFLTETIHTGNFTVNGLSNVLTAKNFKPIKNTIYSFCDTTLTPDKTTGVIRIKNDSGLYHMGVFDESGSAFGYFSDFRSIHLTPNISQAYYMTGQVLHLFMSDPEEFENFVWTAPNGTKYYTADVIIPNATQAMSGIYELTADSKDNNCSTPAPAYIAVNIFTPKKTAETMCSTDVTALTANKLQYAPNTPEVGPYLWTSNNKNMPDTTATIAISPQANTTYTVRSNRPGQNTVVNGDFTNGNVNFSSDYTYGGIGAKAVTISGYYSVGRSANQVNSSYNAIDEHTISGNPFGHYMIVKCKSDVGSKIWTNTYNVTPNTNYNLSAWFITAKQGDTPSLLDYAVNGVPVGKLITPPNAGDGTKQSDWGQFPVVWNSGTFTTATISIITDAGITAGTGVCIDDINFSPLFPVTDTLVAKVVSNIKPVITGDTIICQGKANLDAGGVVNAALSYNWYKEGTATSVGTAKTVSVTSPGKYVVDVTNQICNAKDTFNVAPGNEIKVTLDSVMSICANEQDFTLNYQLLAGELASYNVLYDATAQAGGFSDLNNQSVSSGNQLVIPLPNNVKPGTYNANVQVISKSVCGDSKTIPIKVTVKIKAADLMAQKWNDVIALFNQANNGGLHFTAYQWYKNGVPMAGETGSYLYLGTQKKLDPNDKYSVLLTLDNGTTMLTCDFVPTIKVESISMPTLVSTGQIIPMSVSGVVTFSDVSGMVYSRQTIDANNTQIQAPARKGWYILDLVTDQESLQFKMIVR